MDYHHRLSELRRILSNVVMPLQYVIDTSWRTLTHVRKNWLTRVNLQAHNAELQSRELLLKAKLQRFNALQAENRQLYQLLAATEHLKKQRVELARFLYVSVDTSLNEVLLNKGRLNGVYVGQAVIDADGVLGQVISVDTLTSHVLLLTDFRSAIPVQDVRSDVRGILVGRGRLSKLLLKDVPGTADIKANDLLVTSGLGGHYLPGYLVGVVSMVRVNAATQFATIQVDPSAQLSRNRPVLLIWPEQEESSLLSQTGVNQGPKQGKR